mgnify:CR=1 FL=1|jgi:hypothetical protein
MKIEPTTPPDKLKLQRNVNEDAQALVDALLRGEQADAYCGYGRDGQASNYRDELKWSLHELNKLNKEVSNNEQTWIKCPFKRFVGSADGHPRCRGRERPLKRTLYIYRDIQCDMLYYMVYTRSFMSNSITLKRRITAARNKIYELDNELRYLERLNKVRITQADARALENVCDQYQKATYISIPIKIGVTLDPNGEFDYDTSSFVREVCEQIHEAPRPKGALQKLGMCRQRLINELDRLSKKYDLTVDEIRSYFDGEFWIP